MIHECVMDCLLSIYSIHEWNGLELFSTISFCQQQQQQYPQQLAPSQPLATTGPDDSFQRLFESGPSQPHFLWLHN